MMASLSQTPMFQNMMQSISSNPQLFSQMMASNPMYSQMIQSNPQLAAVLGNPELLRLILSPQVQQAVWQLQQSGQVPGAAHGAHGQAPQGQFPGAAGANPAAAAALMAALSGQAHGQPGMANQAGAQQQPQAAPGATPQMQAQTAQHIRDLASRYEGELRQMEAMGFTDKFANLEALNACDGNVELAINFLFSNSFGEAGSDGSPTNGN